MGTIWNMVTRLYGEYGASRTRLAMIDCSAEGRVAMIRTSLATVDFVKTALAAITMMGNKPATIHVLAVSGTIKALKRRQTSGS